MLSPRAFEEGGMKRTGIVVALMGVAALTACDRRPKDMTGNAVAVAGSYAKTCRNVATAADGTLTADCMDAHSQFRRTSVAAGACHTDIANMNGVLTCSR
jgi:hypothetical protein